MVSLSFLNVDATTIVFIALLAVLIIALLVVPMFTNKKRAKQTDELHRSLKPGDLVKTIGGIVGTIVEIRQISPVDKEMVIETGVGDNKTTMVFDIQALYQVMSRSSTIVPAKEDQPSEEDAESSENNSADNGTQVRVVPDIMADRENNKVNDDIVAEPEQNEVEQPVSHDEAPNTDAAVEQSVAAEEPAAAAADETAAVEQNVQSKRATGGAKKQASGAAKKSGGSKKTTK